ncbi:hypothetical protein CR513_49669, partial [Mucuna pruriens]
MPPCKNQDAPSRQILQECREIFDEATQARTRSPSTNRTQILANHNSRTHQGSSHVVRSDRSPWHPSKAIKDLSAKNSRKRRKKEKPRRIAAELYSDSWEPSKTAESRISICLKPRLSLPRLLDMHHTVIDSSDFDGRHVVHLYTFLQSDPKSVSAPGSRVGLGFSLACMPLTQPFQPSKIQTPNGNIPLNAGGISNPSRISYLHVYPRVVTIVQLERDLSGDIHTLGFIPGSCLKGQWRRTFEGRHDNLLSLLEIDVQTDALSALSQYYDPPLRCFTFRDFQLAPTLEKRERIIRLSLARSPPYLFRGQYPSWALVAKLLKVAYPIEDHHWSWVKPMTRAEWTKHLNDASEKSIR